MQTHLNQPQPLAKRAHAAPNTGSYAEKWFVLPAASALLVIATLPPVKMWWLCFFCLAPIYVFVRISQDNPWKRTALGGFLFGIIFTGFILTLTVLQFHWVKETYLFTNIIRISSFFILICMGVFASTQILLLRAMRSGNAFVQILYASGCWTFSEWCTHKLMLSIEYSIIGYPAHNTTFALLARYGGTYMTIFFVALINMSIGSIVYHIVKRRLAMSHEAEASKYSRAADAPDINGLNIRRSIIVLIACAATAGALHFMTVSGAGTQEESGTAPATIRLALIQNQDRDKTPFGEEKADPQTGETYFSFPRLQELVIEAQKEPAAASGGTSSEAFSATGAPSENPSTRNPLVIVYPFAPWNGAIADKKDKNLFDKKVIATDFETFGEWDKLYIKKDNIFVTWNTTFRDGLFYNEIHFWKNGEIIGYSQKKLLFPFLDYTPMLSQKLGMYTTPIDSSPGDATAGAIIGGRNIGTLVCSEVTHSVQDTNAKDKDLIFAIGSEAIFSSGIAGEFNLGNTVYRAIESNTPIIRANRLGPSAIIDSDGTILAELGFGKEGILHGEITVPKKPGDASGSGFEASRTPFEHHGQDIFIAILLLFTFGLYVTSRNPGELQ